MHEAGSFRSARPHPLGEQYAGLSVNAERFSLSGASTDPVLAQSTLKFLLAWQTDAATQLILEHEQRLLHLTLHDIENHSSCADHSEAPQRSAPSEPGFFLESDGTAHRVSPYYQITRAPPLRERT